MGLFDLFKRSKQQDGDSQQESPNKVDKNVVRMARVVADKHAQNYDRMEAIQALSSVGTGDAAAALLKRFTFYVEPSITDQEEKDTAFQGVLAAGNAAIQPIREFCLRAESLTWPLKLLASIMSEDSYAEEILVLLQRFDTEYTKNVEPKLQLIAALETIKKPQVLAAVEPFLEDVNEPVRFHSVTTVFAQENEQAVESLCKALVQEESVRVRNRICEGLMERAWEIPQSLRESVQRSLPPAFALQAGVIRRQR